MADTDYSIDLRTNSPLWARVCAFFSGGRLVTPEKGSQTGPVSASGTVGDSVVSDERTLQIATVFACVRLISSVVAGLPLDVFETKGDERTRAGLEQPLARLLRYSPNPYMTAVEFREAMTMQLCFYGNAYALIERNGAGDVVSLLPLLSANMDVRLEGKRVIYRYQRDTEYADFKPSEVFHLKGFGFNGLVGLSPIAFATRAAGVAVAMEDQQRDFYANGAKSPQLLMTGDRTLSKDQRAQLEQNFKEIGACGSSRPASPPRPSASARRTPRPWPPASSRSPSWPASSACRRIWSATWNAPPAGARASSSRTWASCSTPSSPIWTAGRRPSGAGWSSRPRSPATTPSTTWKGCCAATRRRARPS